MVNDLVLSFFNKMRVTIDNRKLAESKVAELQKEKEKLSSDIARLKTDEGKEESIREKFGLAKAGEGEIVVVDEKPLTPPAPAPSRGFWGFLKNLLRL